MATQLKTKWIQDRAVTIAKLGSVAGNGLTGADGTANLAVLADGTTITSGPGGVKVTASSINTVELAPGAITAAKLGDDIDGNGLTGGAGSALAVLNDGSSLTVGPLGVKVNASGISSAMISDGAVTEAKLAASVAGTGLQGGAGTSLSVKLDGTSLAAGPSGLSVNNVNNAALQAKSVSASKLGDDIDGNGLTGGDGAALAVLADSTSITVGPGGIKITAGGVDAAMLAGYIPDSKLLQITTTNKVAASAVEDKFLRNDADDTCAGRIQANGFDANSLSVTRVADATANSDAVNYGQMQAYVATTRVWKETLLFAGADGSGQLRDGTTNIGGILAANVLTLSANFQAGDIITLNDGATYEDYTAGSSFVIGGSINASLTNLSAAIQAAPIAASTTTSLLSSIDASNNVMIIWQDVLASAIRIYGDTSAAARVKILPVTKLYGGEESDLVALPTSDPGVTNFGFTRNHAALVAGETHYVRENDSIYTWDHDANVWQQTGAGSIPFASKSVYGKVQISDGINVTSGIISVDADGTTLTVGPAGVKVTGGGITAAELASQSVTAAKIGADVDGDGLTGGSGSALAVLADATSLIVSSLGVKVNAQGVASSMISDGAVTAAKIAAAVAGAGLQGGAGSALSVKTDSTTITSGVNGVKVTTSSINTNELAPGAITAAKLGDDVDGNGLTGGAGSALAVLADGTSLIVSPAGVRVNVKSGGGILIDSTTGLYIDQAQINAMRVYQYTLLASDVTAKTFLLPAAMADTQQIQLTVLGGVMMTYATDYTAVDSTTVGWTGIGLDGVIETGDKLSVAYPI